MKQTILGQPPCRCKKQLKNKYRFCLMVGLLTLLFNVYFTMARTEQNHNLMLALNIVIDIVSGSFLLWYISIHILPQRKMHKLFMRERLPYKVLSALWKTIRCGIWIWIAGAYCWTKESYSCLPVLYACSPGKITPFGWFPTSSWRQNNEKPSAI